jgi:hypothetical protein
MPDERDKRFLAEWRSLFAQVSELVRTLRRFKEQGVEKHNPSPKKVEGEYASLLSRLERLWKTYYVRPPAQRGPEADTRD